MNQYRIWVGKRQSNRGRRSGLFFMPIGLLLIGGEAAEGSSFDINCSSNTPDFNLPLWTVPVSSQAPVGQVLAKITFKLNINYKCSALKPHVRLKIYGKSNIGYKEAGNNFLIFKSGIDGVDIKLITPFSNNTLSGETEHINLKQDKIDKSWEIDYILQLIKTAARVNAGESQSIPLS
ncbi:hypothetical protein [Candidatus Regiella insecticola]|uniref:Uncharacterized protein n=1 Tax=Candidatus Regiella insecticola TaxID=138073 RepID=A0A6L2ZQC4_9ENTR|nr:hypothetical protein [Candidatus Regiella insecticola]GFN46441.1 hypothetical protein RINTU1_20550 [Candidatus Regiella insecticola]